MKIILIIASFLILSDSSNLHQDTPLTIDKNGNIVGLPKTYDNSKFILRDNYLRIKNKEITLPDCVNYYFRIHESPRLYLSASWYHSKDILPYYLNFDISQKNKNYSYNILINLETLELIEIEISIHYESATNIHKIKVDEYCLNEYNKEIKTIEN